MLEYRKVYHTTARLKQREESCSGAKGKGVENGENIKTSKDKHGDYRGRVLCSRLRTRTVRCEIPDRNPLYES